MDLNDKNLVFDLDAVEANLEAGHEDTVQFDRPISDTLYLYDLDGDMLDPDYGTEVSAKDYVARLRQMLAKWGEALTLRFYDHFSHVFDGKSVLAFPEAQKLSLGGFNEVINLEAAFGLPELKRLSLTHYWIKDKTILNHLPLSQLTHLILGQTETKAIDLAPLAKAQSLKRLYLEGHNKNVDELAALTQLEEFTYAAKKGVSLSFINDMSELKALKFVLGGTQSIGEVELPNLRELAFTQVRELCELGDMQRFSSLERLLMQDQQKVEALRFGPGNRSLEHVFLDNCRSIRTVSGLEECPKLKSLTWASSPADIETLPLPASLTHLYLHSGKRKAEAQEKATIEARGYIDDVHPEARFFYK